MAPARPQGQEAEAATSELRREIARMMEALTWPRMVEIALERGDLQRGAKARLNPRTEASERCVEARYSKERVLRRIADGYTKIYSDPAIVAGIARLASSPGGARILARVAARAPAVGAARAHEESKDGAYDTLEAQEREAFRAFAASPAGKEYMAKRARQQEVHRAELASLAAEIAAECRD